LGCVGTGDGNHKLPDHSASVLFPHHPSPISMHGRYVSLVPLTAEHLPNLWSLSRSQPERSCWLPIGQYIDSKLFKTYAKLLMSSQNEIVWSVCPRGADGHIGAPGGWLALLDVDIVHATIELGNVWFPQPLSRSRAATEALTLLLGLVFDEQGYQNVTWKCEDRNVPSARCAERLGFSRATGTPPYPLARPRLPDWRYFNLHAEDWPARRDALQDWLAPENFDHQGHQLRPLARAV
jgi:RimJ/RimL family protein N-acetyltransferase